jgi:uncharacterized protein
VSLEELLLEHQNVATRAKDRFRLKVIRNLRAELKNAVIAKRAPLNSDEEITVLAREVKQRLDSLADYERADRPELLAEMKQEIELLRQYLPEQLSEAEIDDLVSRAIRETGAAAPKDLGRVMGWLMPQIKGKADGTLVRKIVEQRLQ